MTHHIPSETLRALWADRSITIAGIATTLWVSKDTVLRRVTALELPPRRPQRTARRPRAEAAAERAQAQVRLAELWADPTLPLAEIATTMGLDRETMLRWAATMGLPLTQRPRRRSPGRAAAKDAWRALLPGLRGRSFRWRRLPLERMGQGRQSGEQRHYALGIGLPYAAQRLVPDLLPIPPGRVGTPARGGVGQVGQDRENRAQHQRGQGVERVVLEQGGGSCGQCADGGLEGRASSFSRLAGSDHVSPRVASGRAMSRP